MNLYDPAVAFGLGMAVASVLTLLVAAHGQRNNHRWQRRCYSLQTENSRLRAANLRLNNHPSTRFRPDVEAAIEVSLQHAAHTADALAAVADVVEFPKQRGAGWLS